MSTRRPRHRQTPEYTRESTTDKTTQMWHRKATPAPARHRLLGNGNRGNRPTPSPVDTAHPRRSFTPSSTPYPQPSAKTRTPPTPSTPGDTTSTNTAPASSTTAPKTSNASSIRGERGSHVDAPAGERSTVDRWRGGAVMASPHGAVRAPVRVRSTWGIDSNGDSNTSSPGTSHPTIHIRITNIMLNRSVGDPTRIRWGPW